jgi:hypothetical protein
MSAEWTTSSPRLASWKAERSAAARTDAGQRIGTVGRLSAAARGGCAWFRAGALALT